MSKFKKFKTNGMSKTYVYRCYYAMLQRCIDSNHHAFERYGGRGILIDKEWLGENGFINFINDMGERPEKHSLDRKDVNKGYNKYNCRWATETEQVTNRRGFGCTSNNSGISFNKKDKNWSSSIYYCGDYIFSKRFKTEEEAVSARNDFIIKNNLPHILN